MSEPLDVLAAQVRAELQWFRGDHLPHGSHEDMFEAADRALMALDALVARVTASEAEATEYAALAGRFWADAADARNALERIAQLTAQDRTPRETWTTTENAAAAGLEPARKLAREVLARLDGNQS